MLISFRIVAKLAPAEQSMNIVPMQLRESSDSTTGAVILSQRIVLPIILAASIGGLVKMQCLFRAESDQSNAKFVRKDSSPYSSL